MQRTVLVALALLPMVAVATLPADGASRSYPRGGVIVRPECFGAAGVEATTQSHRGRRPRLSWPGSGRSTRSAGSKAGGAAPPPPSPAPMEEAEESMGPSAYDSVEEVPVANEWVGDEDIASQDSLVEMRNREKVQVERDVKKVLVWGATVYLSNDDSMSLASAQRVLYAAMNGMRVPLQEIRPHELLNYFSFDTATPDGDQLFDVLASAEQHGDQLSVALSVKGATPEREPLDLTMLVDRSCSMDAEGRMDYTKRGLTLMSEQLVDGDRVDLVVFDDGVCAPLENFVVGRDDPRLLQNTIDAMMPEGSTDLDLGLRKAYDIAKGHVDTRGRNRRVMVLTDALLNTGDVNHDTVSEIGKAFEQDGIRVTGVGVGREFNDDVLDMLTEKGKGAYVYLGSEAVVDRVFGAVGFQSLVQTIAHDVRFALKLPDSLAMERFYGEESSTDPEQVQPINYYAGTSQLFLQDLQMRGGSPRRGDKVALEITYEDARTGQQKKRIFQTTVGKMVDTDKHNVRKARALMAWTDLLMADALGGAGCQDPLQAYAARAAEVPEDAEIAFVNGLVQSRCGRLSLPEQVATRPRVPFKVRVDADAPITDVYLTCGGQRWSQGLTGSDTVARFEAPVGACEVTLAGRIDLSTKVSVPSTGGDVRCAAAASSACEI